jgi:hypothetical protein
MATLPRALRLNYAKQNIMQLQTVCCTPANSGFVQKLLFFCTKLFAEPVSFLFLSQNTIFYKFYYAI